MVSVYERGHIYTEGIERICFGEKTYPGGNLLINANYVDPQWVEFWVYPAAIPGLIEALKEAQK